MSRSGLTDLYTDYRWYQFSKKYKEQYKEENNKALEGDVLVEITFNKLIRVVNKLQTKTNEDGTVTKEIVQVNEARLPDLEDCVLLTVLGNENCNEEGAVLKIHNYLAREENAGIGLTGVFLDLCCDIHKDLPYIAGGYKRAVEVRNKYRESLKEKIETTSTETDTQ